MTWVPRSLVEEILKKNEDTISKITRAIRRIRAKGVAGLTVCIRPDSKEITAWASGFGGKPILNCGKNEKELTLYFYTPDYFLSKKDVAELIADNLLAEEEFEK